MPICKNCGKMEASAETRRTPDGRAVCRNKTACKERTKRLPEQARAAQLGDMEELMRLQRIRVVNRVAGDVR